MKTIDFLKKSNSDRSERRSTRKKPTHLSEQLQSSEEDEHRKLSDISEHRKTISCSTPSFLLQPSIDINEGGDDKTDDGRKRSITTDSISPPPKQPSMVATIKQQQIIPSGSKTIKNLPTRKTSDQQFSSSVRLRDCSKSVSTLGSVFPFHSF
uniref:Uncharacterized protein n=1 Tax=Panagrolaimus davidi TaxID=227884 RepID=A0A914P4X1_9BILA